MTQAQEHILSEACRLGVDVLYSEKGHFMAARKWKNVSYWLNIPSTIFAATAGASFFKGSHSDLAGWLAVAAAALTGVATALSPADRFARHHRAGVLYAGLRRQIRSFVQVEARLTGRDESLLNTLHQLTSRVSKLQGESPPISARAYTRAKRSIDSGSADYTESELIAATGELASDVGGSE